MKEKKTTFYYIMTFLGILALSCGAGFILGKFIGRTEKAGNLQTFVSGIITFCIHAAPIVFLILSISGMLAAILTYLKCKKHLCYSSGSVHSRNLCIPHRYLSGSHGVHNMDGKYCQLFPESHGVGTAQMNPKQRPQKFKILFVFNKVQDS